MGIFLALLAFVFLIVGLIGAVLPVIPGPALSFIGLLILQWSGHGGFSSVFLWVWGGITVVVTVIDYILPAWLTKIFGGSRAAVVGSIIGLIIGIFIPPVGLLIGPFLGALIGQIFHNYMHPEVPEEDAAQAAPAGVKKDMPASAQADEKQLVPAEENLIPAEDIEYKIIPIEENENQLVPFEAKENALVPAEPGEKKSGPAEAKTSKNASPLKAALGAFLAFIVGTGAKLIISFMMLYYAGKAIITAIKTFFFS